MLCNESIYGVTIRQASRTDAQLCRYLGTCTVTSSATTDIYQPDQSVFLVHISFFYTSLIEKFIELFETIVIF